MRATAKTILFSTSFAFAVIGWISTVRVPQAIAQEAASCTAWDVEYVLAAKLKLSDTPKGAGDGVYPVGPGTMVIRFAGADGKAGPAEMRKYTMTQNFRVDSTVLFWKTHVVTASKTTTTPDGQGVVAKGQVQGKSLKWQTPLAGCRTDGTLTCDGSLCGKFGAPPPGQSELHVPPHAVEFQPLTFSDDMKTFSMPSTFVAKTDNPQQTAHIAISGRETNRTCVK
ncbi:MAG: hypothetical protein FWD69_16080 [Polyangiaceae bacterium]|nr:hypothetical protein [Polyangiaceae bacterium]